MDDGLKNASCECPICRSQAIGVVRRISSRAAARHFVNPGRNHHLYETLCAHITTLWGEDYCRICRCLECGFGFSDPYIAGDETFYNLAYDRKRGDYPKDKWEYVVAIDTLRNCIDAHGRDAIRLLEIGAGDGAFLRRIVPEVIGPERILCTEYGDYGVAQIRKLGIRVERGDIRDISVGNADVFNVVCLFQILEHMDRLRELFARLRMLTSSKADLLIAVPNVKRNSFNEHNGALLDMPPNHIGRWTESSFGALAKREGWAVVRFLVEPTNSRRSWQQFAIDRYANASQRDGSFSARIRGRAEGGFGRALEVAMVAAFAIRSVPLLPKLFSEGMGDSVFIHLRKKG
jgi:hypothetical protein